MDRFSSNDEMNYQKYPAYSEGMQARIWGLPWLDNPYPQQSMSYKMWNMGWSDQDMDFINKEVR